MRLCREDTGWNVDQVSRRTVYRFLGNRSTIPLPVVIENGTILSSPRRLAPFPFPLFANRSIHALGIHEYCARDYRPRDSLGIAPSRLICSTIRHLNEDTIAFWIALETNSERGERFGFSSWLVLVTVQIDVVVSPRRANWIHASLFFAAYLNDVGQTEGKQKHSTTLYLERKK